MVNDDLKALVKKYISIVGFLDQIDSGIPPPTVYVTRCGITFGLYKIQNLWTILNSCKQICNYSYKSCWKQRLKATAETDISISIFWLCLLNPSKTYSVALVLPSIGFLELLYIFATSNCSLGRSSLFEISYMLFELSQSMQQPCLGNSRRHGWSCQ